MEQINSNSEKKMQQVDIFKRYASPLESYSDGLEDGRSGELVLKYDNFIKLITNSQKLHSKATDHSFSLNQIPSNVFGCIFFAIDERNKGYLTISDWFHFSNILEHENYHLILLYEFFRKFDIANGQRRNSAETSSRGELLRPINYSNKFLSFDELLLNLDQFKATINLLHGSIDDEFSKENDLFMDWNSFDFLKFYECFPSKNHHSDSGDSYLTLNSLITILQNDLKNLRMKNGFERLCSRDPDHHNLVLNRVQCMGLLKLFFQHRVSSDIFDSVNLSNTSLLKSKNNAIPYNVFKDIFYLFQNFDLLNQVLLKYASDNNLSNDDLRENIITKRKLMKILNQQYNKVNNINEFSPSQINLLFSIVANSKENNRKKIENHSNDSHDSYHQDSQIDNFIQNEFKSGGNIKKKQLEVFNNNYLASLETFAQDAPFKKLSRASAEFFDAIFNGKRDPATMGSNLTIQDFLKILNPNYLNDLVHQLEVKQINRESLYVNYYFYPIFDSLYNFALGSIAGCIGATAVYPIDFVKTRMQAQRSLSKYKSSFDCIIKVIKNEGIRGPYSGLGFQLIGVAPEKAIKLTVNDYLRKKLVDNKGNLHLLFEVLSGAAAGTCQVIFTNPIEIVKIRLQVKSEYAPDKQLSAIQIINKLGFRGLYKGVLACLMRDVPFSAIYFPTYAHIKRDIFNFDPNDKTKRKRLKTWELLTSGAIAGIPAAFLTTPFDVIKTRLQIDPRKGETVYKGIFHAARTILKEECLRSFFKGGGARVLRSSPQFGFTLAAYELFKNVFPLPNLEEKIKTDRNQINDVPSIVSPVSTFLDNVNEHPNSSNKFTNGTDTSSNATLDTYSRNYLYYYYKSCQTAKTFIDLDNSFSKFDHSAYLKFHENLKRIQDNDSGRDCSTNGK